MNWKHLLKTQQDDLIKRLKSKDLIDCKIDGIYSELTVISGERLGELRNYCWRVAQKYIQAYPIHEVFVNTLKGKLGEEVVKTLLGDLVKEASYQIKLQHRGKVDLCLKNHPEITIQVKTVYHDIDTAEWWVSQEEIDKNHVIVCVLCLENFDYTHNKYELILAGFLPTEMINITDTSTGLKMEQLLYGAGLKFYLETLPEKTPNYLHLATKCHQKGNYHKAIAFYDKLLVLEKEQDYLYVFRGISNFKLGKINLAKADFDLAIASNKEYALAYHCRGYLSLMLGDYQGALVDYNQEIKYNSNSYYAYHNRGITHVKMKKYEQAVSDFTKAIYLNPYLFHAYYNRGNAYYYCGDKLKAIEDYQQAIMINPRLFQGYYNRGVSRCSLGQIQEAITDYSKAIEINSNYANAHYNRGNLYYELGEYQKAVEDYNEAIRSNNNLFQAHYNRGVVLKYLNNDQNVISAQSRLDDINSQNIFAYYQLYLAGLSDKKHSELAELEYTPSNYDNNNIDEEEDV